MADYFFIFGVFAFAPFAAGFIIGWLWRGDRPTIVHIAAIESTFGTQEMNFYISAGLAKEHIKKDISSIRPPQDYYVYEGHKINDKLLKRGENE